MKILKRLTALVLCAVLAAGVMPGPAEAKTKYKVSRENFYVYSSDKWVPKEETKYTYSDGGRLKKTVYGYDGIKLDNSRYRTVKTTKYTYKNGKISKLQYYNTKGEKHGYVTYVYASNGKLQRWVERREDGTLKAEEVYFTKGSSKGKIKSHATYKTNGTTVRTQEKYSYTYYKSGELKEEECESFIRGTSETKTTTRYNKDGSIKYVDLSLKTDKMTQKSHSDYSYTKSGSALKTQTVKTSEKQTYAKYQWIKHEITEVTTYSTSGNNKGEPTQIVTKIDGKLRASKDSAVTTSSKTEKQTYEYTYDSHGNLKQKLLRLNGGVYEKWTYKYKSF